VNSTKKNIFARTVVLNSKIKKKQKKSLIYPGGGYFYTRHPFLAIGDAIVETGLIAIMISFINIINSVEGNTNELFIIFIILTIILAIEKAITIHHFNNCIREYITKEKKIRPIS